MKKIFNWLMLLPALVLFGACAQEEIVFDHEKPAFETKDGQILLEVIVPSTTKADDVIYISGPFNGGDEVAEADVTWHLEKSTTIDKKWGIYLDPSTFVDGKTLADGYRFVSVREGEERTARNEAVNRTENPAPGTSTNIYVAHWNMFFYVAPEIKHDGPVVYVDDQTGWDALAMYAWGDAEAFGGWPGQQPAGTAKIAGVEYTYFEYAVADVDGLGQNLIFNNNGGGIQTADQPLTFSADVVDHFYVLYGEKDCAVIADPFNREPIVAPDPEPEPEPDPDAPTDPVPVVFYVQNNTGYDATYMYAWGDALPELFGGWPGIALENNVTCGGVAYSRVETTATAYDLVYHPIFNNNNGTQYDAPVVTIAQYNFIVAGETAAEIGTAPALKVYVDDQTGWDAITMYSWGDINDVVGGWPGAACTTETVNGKEYKVFEIPANGFGTTCNLIFNNNGGGTQLADYNVVADRDLYLTVTAEGVTPIE